MNSNMLSRLFANILNVILNVTFENIDLERDENAEVARSFAKDLGELSRPSDCTRF
jgi:hypothetical protein